MFFRYRNAPLSLKGQYNLAVASQRLVIKVALVAVAKQVTRARLLLIKDEVLRYHLRVARTSAEQTYLGLRIKQNLPFIDHVQIKDEELPYIPTYLMSTNQLRNTVLTILSLTEVLLLGQRQRKGCLS